MLNEVKSGIPVEWSYTEHGMSCVCAIDGSKGSCDIRIEKNGTEFVDCLKAKGLFANMAAIPTTAEQLASALAEELRGYRVSVTWFSDNHGPIEVTAKCFAWMPWIF